MRGRKKLPTEYKRMKGTLQNCRTNFDEPQLDIEAPDKPKGMGRLASKEWDRILPILLSMRVMTPADMAALQAYCMSYERWIQAEKEIQKTSPIIHVIEGRRSIPKVNPLVRVSNLAVDTMYKFLREFGLTPSSRAGLKITRREEKNSWESFSKAFGEAESASDTSSVVQ